MVGDGHTKYDHEFDGHGQESGGCHFEYRNTKDPTKVRIISWPQGLRLEYKTSTDEDFNVCFNTNISVPNNQYIGFTGMTGGVSARHEIISLHSFELTVY